MRHLLFLALATLVLAALLAPGCSFAPEHLPVLVEGRAAAFSHAVHADEELALFCSDCHATVDTAAEAGMPSLEHCAGCHPADEESGTLPDELKRFLGEDGEPVWTAGAAIGIEHGFSHAWHGSAGVSCRSCHGAVEESDGITTEVAVRMADCVACHEKREVDTGGCAGCHAGIDEGWMPATHSAGWERAHGRVWLAGGGLDRAAVPAADCQLCHDGTSATPSCDSCHAQNPPADHTGFFRNRGHGMLALADQQRCNACHLEDTCLECHLEQRPASHGPGFGAPADRHCLGCHLETGQEQACAVCHLDGAVSHDLAPTPPPTVPAHANASSCLTCHASVKRPRHPYTGDGDYCRRCHQ
jgi:hypothetical protein